ncbi:MAG: hypothetical protein C0625_01655 [Arcobacter sp.]|nr:MAG: hypothetical protein C0625_01655 [Arcobacter sp.]
MAAYQEKVNLAYANAFTETGAMYASMAGKLKIEADKAAEIADEANSDLKTAIVDAASEGLDYSLYSIQELDSLISGIDYTAYRDTLKEISDISLVVKDTKIMTDQQQEALISLYSGENFIKARDAKDIKDAIEAQIQSIKDLEDSAVEFIDTTFATFMDNIKDLGTVIFDLADETKSTIESIKFSGYSEKDQLVEFNKLRTEISSYFDGTANFSEDELSSKYSSLLSFGTNVASSSESLRGDILNYLDGNLGKFNDQENILRVNIVDGLSQIEGFSQEQSLSLKDAIADGRLSLSELLEIKDLSTAQIQSIINMVDNTEAIAKDDTLNYVLLSNMEGFNALADAAKEASKTEIISGLDNLELYSQNQLVALREALADTVITNNELNNIAGLTEQQKDNIITVANNSEYFSTESTLGLMTTLLQYQLEELKKTNALETTGLSSSSFEYGDYIGKQEQIDISNIFGRAYDENIAETIKRLQGLNLSANPEEELKSLLGYTGYGDTSYQKDLGSTLLKLDPYLSSVNIPDVISSIDTEMNAYNEKQAFLSTLESARTNYELQKSQSDAQLAKFAPFNSKQEDFENNSKAVLSPFGMYFLSSYYSAYEKEFEEAYSSYATYKSLLNQKQILGYENGTSNMKDDQLALFNNQEIVIPTSFSEGIRNGDISMSNNQELLDEHRKTRDAILLAVEELKDINSSTGEMNSRQQITIKKVS